MCENRKLHRMLTVRWMNTIKVSCLFSLEDWYWCPSDKILSGGGTELSGGGRKQEILLIALENSILYFWNNSVKLRHFKQKT